MWLADPDHPFHACRYPGRQTAASVAQSSSRSRTVRTYSLLGGLFGGKKADMGAGGSKTEAREGWAPATGETHAACQAVAVPGPNPSPITTIEGVVHLLK